MNAPGTDAASGLEERLRRADEAVKAERAADKKARRADPSRHKTENAERASFTGRLKNWWAVSEPWERIYLLAFPVVLTLGFLQGAGYLGVPRLLRGILFLVTAYYVGFWFTILLNIDRRMDSLAGKRSRGTRKRAMDDMKQRLGDRKDAMRAHRTADVRNAEARRRGEIKAGRLPADAPPPAIEPVEEPIDD